MLDLTKKAIKGKYGIETLRKNKSGNTKDIKKNILVGKTMCTFAKVLFYQQLSVVEKQKRLILEQI